jgi:hypothetical protein
VWNRSAEDDSIHHSIEWSYRKNEWDIDWKCKEYIQWSMVSIGILDRESGYCMLPLNNHLQQHWLIKLHMRHGFVRKHLPNISKFLVVMLLCMFQRRKEVSWHKHKLYLYFIIKMV